MSQFPVKLSLVSRNEIGVGGELIKTFKVVDFGGALMNFAKLRVDCGVVQLSSSRSWLLCTLIIVLVILIAFGLRKGLSSTTFSELRTENDSVSD